MCVSICKPLLVLFMVNSDMFVHSFYFSPCIEFVTNFIFHILFTPLISFKFD